MHSKKEHTICFILAMCVLLFGCFFSGNPETRHFGMDETVNPYNAEITLYGEKPANSEICTIEMLGIGNTVAFVRCEKRSSFQPYVNLPQILLSYADFNPAISGNNIERQTNEEIVSLSDAVIVQYIHNQDGQK